MAEPTKRDQAEKGAQTTKKSTAATEPKPSTAPASRPRSAGTGVAAGAKPRGATSQPGEAAPSKTPAEIERIHAERKGEGRVDPRFLAGRLLKYLGCQWVQKYHRLEIQGDLPKLDRPTMLLSHHGFGGVLDLNVFAMWTVENKLKFDRPLVALGHGIAWKFGGGPFMEGLGGVAASPTAAEDALRDGCHLGVMPGGDYEAFKPFKDRNKVDFGGRKGFARLAIKMKVPILPIVTVGAGETLFVLSRGEKLAKVLGIERFGRFKAFPVTLSVPWGLSVGNVGTSTPYLPLPAKIVTRVLPLMEAESDESVDHFAARVQEAMQSAMDDMTKNRTFLLG